MKSSPSLHDQRCEKCGALVRAIMGECKREGCPQSLSRNDSVDSEYLAAYIERCAESEAPLHLTKRERLFIADAILIAAEKSAHSETQPIPHWTCGCGHVNGCNLEWCAMCYRRPNGSHKDE